MIWLSIGPSSTWRISWLRWPGKKSSLLLWGKVTLLQPRMIESYPTRALDRRLQEDWAKDAREGPRVLMSLRVDFGPMG